MEIHPDFDDFISSLNKYNVEFVIVGSFALFFYGKPRATGDIDIWINPNKENAKRLLSAIDDFGFGSLKLSVEDILSGDIIQMGFPPVRIDLLTVLDGITSEEIWNDKAEGLIGKNNVFFIGKSTYIKNKKTIGRSKDIADLDSLGVK